MVEAARLEKPRDELYIIFYYKYVFVLVHLFLPRKHSILRV